MRVTQKYLTELGYQITGCAIEVHRNLGPGLLESVYEPCFLHELKSSGMDVKSQVWVPVIYKGINFGGQLKLDLLVNDCIIVEIKAVDAMISIFEAQLLSYLKLTGMPKGLLINFHSETIVSQLKSFVTEEFARLPPN